MLGIVSWATCGDGRSRERRQQHAHDEQLNTDQLVHTEYSSGETEHAHNTVPDGEPEQHAHTEVSNSKMEQSNTPTEEDRSAGHERLVLTQQYREEVGRRAKQLLDWGRVLYLRGCGFEARLCYYVPASVSLENVCIVAKKPS